MGKVLNGLSLFSGIGGIDLALSEWVRPILYCERERYAQGVLMSRMSSGELPNAPIATDVCDLRADAGTFDIVYGGFPCQDLSAAGAGAGLAGERSGLYFELERIISEAKPTFVFLENVPAIRTRGLGRVVWGLSELGYDLRWTVVSAQEVGACHKRNRWFLLAYTNGLNLRLQPNRIAELKKKNDSSVNGKPRSIAYANGERLERIGRSESGVTRPAAYNGWKSQPTIQRGVNGVPNRVDRLRGLGNAVVPLQAKEAFMRLMGMK